MMTGTRLASERVLGSAWPGHFNRPIAEDMTDNIKLVGLPKWTAADQRFARAIQKEVKGDTTGLDTAVAKLEGDLPDDATTWLRGFDLVVLGDDGRITLNEVYTHSFDHDPRVDA